MGTYTVTSCPDCYKSFRKSEMKRRLHPNMTEYIYLCRECCKDFDKKHKQN